MVSASIGATFQLPSNVYSGSYTCCMIVPTRSAVDAIGSSVCGSATIARFAAPPLAGAANVRSAASTVTNIAVSRAPATMRRRMCKAKGGGNETTEIMAAAPRMVGRQFKLKLGSDSHFDLNPVLFCPKAKWESDPNSLHRRRSVPPRAGMLQIDSARECERRQVRDDPR